MQKTLLTIRIFFILLCVMGSLLMVYVNPAWEDRAFQVVTIGFLIGILVVLVDILLKGFSLRGLSAVTFGLGIGALVAFLISSSPLFEYGDEETIYLVRLGLFIIMMYLGTVIALRGKDEFNLVIPYVRFVPHDVDVPLVVVDTSALIDGRIARIYDTRFLSAALIIPRFVLNELQRIADSSDPLRKARGRRGLQVLNELRKMEHVDLRIEESEVKNEKNVDAKLVFLARTLKAKLLTTDYNLARMAEFNGIPWLNLTSLEKALSRDLYIGETVEVDLVKPGRDPGQAVGYLPDGSMVVVNDGQPSIGQEVTAEIISILPSSGGKMIFANCVKTEKKNR